MDVERVAGAAEFLVRTEGLRAAEPVLTNVMGSVAQSVAAGREYAAEYWWLVRDHSGVVGCAMRTAPWNLLVSPMSGDAARSLATAVGVNDPGLPGITGPRKVVDAVTEALARAGPVGARSARLAMTDVVYELGRFVPPAGVAGAPRLARHDELELMVAWHEQFALDAGVPSHDSRSSVESRLSERAIWCWELDGQLVAMAAHAPPVRTPGGVVGRIGPVYTPSQWRRRGFGAAITAAVVARLQPVCSTIMLFADAANPTSNGVYARLGFRATAEVVEVRFD